LLLAATLWRDETRHKHANRKESNEIILAQNNNKYIVLQAGTLMVS